MTERTIDSELGHKTQTQGKKQKSAKTGEYEVSIQQKRKKLKGMNMTQNTLPTQQRNCCACN